MQQRKPEIDIRPSFLHQLAKLEQKLAKKGAGPETSTWNEVSQDPNVANDDLVLRNTFVNAQIGELQEMYDEGEKDEFKLKWMDNGTDNKDELHDVDHPGVLNPVEEGFVLLRSALKGGT